MQTYLFYDIETSGLNAAFDQILTFAAIRTDRQLNEIERDEIRVRWRPDIVPSPGALITHRLSKDALESGHLEYQAARQIHQELNRPGTVSIGYNTLGFDDSFLRFTFYRNLLDPYTHQYALGCSRMDLLPMVTLYRIFKQEILKWPEIKGKPSLKLEWLNQENSLFTKGRAHDAMTDVEVTLALARRLAGEKKIWQYCHSFFEKKTDKARLEKMGKNVVTSHGNYCTALMVDPAMGADVLFMAPVVGIGPSDKYANQTLWFRLDREDFSANFDKPEESWVIRKRLGESKIVLPPLSRFWKRLFLQQQELCQKNLDAIAHHPDQFRAMVDYHRSYVYPDVPNVDPDAALYQEGFFTHSEKKEIARFHTAASEKLLQVCRGMSSPRIKILAQRILSRNFDAIEDECSLADYMTRLRTRDSGSIVGYRGDTKLNCEDVKKELEECRKKMNLDQEQKDLLDELEIFLEKF